MAAEQTLAGVAKPKNDAQITFRLPEEDKNDLEEAAARRDRTHNWLARQIILEWLLSERRRRSRRKRRSARPVR